MPAASPTIPEEAAEIADGAAEALHSEPRPTPVEEYATAKEMRATPPPLPPSQERRERVNAFKDARDDAKPPSIPAEPVDPSPTFGERVGALVKKIGPADPEMGWEQAVWSFWLPRFGILLMAAAVVFGLSLAFQSMGAQGRVATGYGVAAALFGLGWWTDRRFPSYARAVFGGAFAMTYVVTYATHYMEFSRIFDSPWPSLFGLAGVIVAWIAWAQWRQSKTIAVVAVVVGHFTLALATHTADNPGFYTVGGLVALGLGSAFFLWRNGWTIPTLLGMVLTYANHFYLLTRIDGEGTTGEFIVGMAVLGLYFLTYAASAWGFKPGQNPRWLMSGFVAANTAGLFALATLFMGGFDFARDQQHLLAFALSGVLLGLGLAHRYTRVVDGLQNVYLTSAVAIFTYGLNYRFDGEALSAFLAVETVVLLLSARRAQLPVAQLLAYGVGALGFGHALMSLVEMPEVSYSDEAFPRLAFQYGVSIAALLAAAIVHERIRWSAMWEETNDGFVQLLKWRFPEPAERWVAWGYAVAGVVLAGVAAMSGFLAFEDAAIFVLGLTTVLAAAAVPLRSTAWGRAVVVGMFVGAAYSAYHAFVSIMHPYEFNALLFRGAFAVGSLVFLSEWIRRISGRAAMENVFPAFWYIPIDSPSIRWISAKPEGAFVTRVATYPALLAASLMCVWTFSLVDVGFRTLTLMACAAGLWSAARPLRSWPFGLAALLPLMLALPVGVLEFPNNASPQAALPTLLIAAALYVSTHERLRGDGVAWRLAGTRWVPALFAGALMLLGGVYVTSDISETWRAVALGGAGAVALGMALRFRPRLTSCLAAVWIAWATVLWHIDAVGADSTWRMGAGLALVAVSIMLERACAGRIPDAMRVLGVGLAWSVLVRFAHLEAAEAWLPGAWSLVVVAFLAGALGLRRVEYAAAALGALALASVYAFVRGGEMEDAPALATALGFAAPAALWLAGDRLARRFVTRDDLTKALALCTPIAAALLVVLPMRIDTLAEQFLTVSWSVLGVALFAWAVYTRETLHRYACLAVLALAVGRVVIVDTADLQALYRVGAFMAVGLALLGLGLAYMKAFVQDKDVTTGNGSDTKADSVQDDTPPQDDA